MTSLESFGRLLYTFSYVIIYLFFSSEKKFLMALTKYLIKIFLFVILLSPCLFLSIWNVHIPTRCWHGSNDSLGSLAYTSRDLQWSRILRGHSWVPQGTVLQLQFIDYKRLLRMTPANLYLSKPEVIYSLSRTCFLQFPQRGVIQLLLELVYMWGN